ncbi:MAG: PAS domain-containing sensor histidine kinase [Ferruginibacter sp.]
MDAKTQENSHISISQPEQRFKSIIDNLPHMVWEIEPDGVISYINKQWVKWSGLTLAEIKAGGWGDLFHPEDALKIAKDWQEAFLNKNEFTGEYRIVKSDGGYAWFLFNTVPIRDSAGEIIKWSGTATNIDKHRTAVSVLKESENKFRQLADIMPQQVWTASADGELDYVNQVAVDYFGETEDKIVGAGWQSVIHPEDIDHVINSWVKSLANLEPYQVEFRLKAKDGTFKWHLARASCFQNEEKKVRWIGTNTDIEVHKSNEQKKDVFFSMASHELKTPVTSIKGYAYILGTMLEGETNAEAAAIVKRMDTQITKLTRLIGDLLNASKIESQQLQLALREFNFKDLVEECVSGAQLRSPGHKIILETNEDIIYNGDPLRLEQVFDNFLNNAVKYSPEGKRVVVRYWIQGNNIVVSVEDFGIGIEKDNINKIFDRFYRIDNTSMKFQGLGLGLYISSEIIKAHQGSFWLESELGKGTVFYFLLPLNNNTLEMEINTDNQTYYFTPQYHIKYNKEDHWLEVDWIGFHNFDSVKSGCLQTLELLKKNNCTKVLNDNTNVLGNWSEAVDWGAGVWFPAMQQAGLQFFAWIYSPSTFSRLAAHKSLDVMVGTITTQFFTGLQEGKQWLKNSSAKIPG